MKPIIVVDDGGGIWSRSAIYNSQLVDLKPIQTAFFFLSRIKPQLVVFLNLNHGDGRRFELLLSISTKKKLIFFLFFLVKGQNGHYNIL